MKTVWETLQSHTLQYVWTLSLHVLREHNHYFNYFVATIVWHCAATREKQLGFLASKKKEKKKKEDVNSLGCCYHWRQREPNPLSSDSLEECAVCVLRLALFLLRTAGGSCYGLVALAWEGLLSSVWSAWTYVGYKSVPKDIKRFSQLNYVLYIRAELDLFIGLTLTGQGPGVGWGGGGGWWLWCGDRVGEGGKREAERKWLEDIKTETICCHHNRKINEGVHRGLRGCRGEEGGRWGVGVRLTD